MVSDNTKALIAGGIAGAVSRTATAPLERLKIIQQVRSTKKYNGVFNSLRTIYYEQGLKAMWRGNFVNVIRIIPYSAIQFSSFDVYRRYLAPNNESHKLLVAGGLAGTTSMIVSYPLDFARSVLAAQTKNRIYNGMYDVLRQSYRQFGIYGWYKGLGLSLSGITPYIAINFTVFDFLKRTYMPNKNHPYFDLINLGMGAFAGGFAVSITYPTDALRRKMQLNGLVGLKTQQYKNSFDCIKRTYHEEGVKGFYRGLAPCYLKVIPSMAIAFMTYEHLKRAWKFNGGRPST